MKSQKNSKHVPNSEEISTVDVKGSKKTGKVGLVAYFVVKCWKFDLVCVTLIIVFVVRD